jgi:sporulation protein YlmC with PRC-barrel domain
MKMLLSSTAMMVALSLPTMTVAQSQAPAANPAYTQQTTETKGFLSQRAQSDIFASELMGHNVYARRTAAETSGTAQGQTMADGAPRDMAMMQSADLEEMDMIGQINEIVLSHDGQVRALVIGIGGFLGMGEQDVAVTMDQITVAANSDDRSEMYVVVNAGPDLLKSSPAYQRMSMTTAQTDANLAQGSERSPFAAPEMARDGYEPVEATDVTTELLMGKSVYDVNETDVGTVTDMVLDDKGAITDVIVDFGGFLGMGVSHAALSFDELTLLSTDGFGDLRVYVDATKSQIQDLPQYEAAR